MTSDGRNLRICLFGASLDVGNMGCRALSVSLIKLLLDSDPNARIVLMYGNRTAGEREVRLKTGKTVRIPLVNFRLSPKAHLHEHLIWILFLALVYRFLPVSALRGRILASNPWLRHLAQADLVGDIRGGDSFADIYGIRRFLLGNAPAFAAILLRKPLIFLPQTFGPYRSWLARAIARFTLKHSPRVFSRDRAGVDVIKKILGEVEASKRVRFCPDVAFSLEPIEPARMEVEPPLPAAGGETLVGLNVSGLLYMGGYSRDNMFRLRFDYAGFVGKLVERLLAVPNTRVLLVPHNFGLSEENDEAACRKAWEEYRGPSRERLHLLTGEYDQNEVKAVIRRCDFFVGSRMHACIAALSQGIPCVGIAYSRKFHGVFETVGLQDMVLDARDLPEQDLLEGCLGRFRNREAAASVLRRTVPTVRADLEACFRTMVLGAAQPTQP